ncbi:MAG: hypothetical protein RI964_1981 [Pseudomonadota bacterium]|jgi:hypothetical protein
MIYKIVMDDTQADEVNFIISLPGIKIADLHINLRLAENHLIKNINRSGLSHSSDHVGRECVEMLDLVDLQEGLIIIINHLVNNGYATYSGKYQRGVKKVPVFRGETLDGLYVDSVDKKTGQKLLKGCYMKNPNKVRKLMDWIVYKFPIVSEWAGMDYHAALKDEKRLNQIIIMASRFVLNRNMIMPSRRERSLNRPGRSVDDRQSI